MTSGTTNHDAHLRLIEKIAADAGQLSLGLAEVITVIDELTTHVRGQNQDFEQLKQSAGSPVAPNRPVPSSATPGRRSKARKRGSGTR